MARRLVVCCDGTWNRPRTGTNIHRTYQRLWRLIGEPEEDRGLLDGSRCCRGRAPDGAEMLLYYDKGVGTAPWDWLIGGAFGVGLSDNVRGAYRFLSQSHEPGDEIYIFGFSRGAYTARSLCGFLAATGGLIAKASVLDVLRAYARYYVTADRTTTVDGQRGLPALAGLLKAELGELAGRDLDRAPRHEAKVRFVGVYDTVGALGVPLPKAEHINTTIVGFHKTDLSPVVEHAVHALAVDERRGPYQPTLWRPLTEGEELPASRSCLQVWFPGVHSDVGGGYQDKGIGDITLGFMLHEACRRGLVGTGASLTVDPPAGLPGQHDSFDGKWRAIAHLFEEADHLRAIGPTARQTRGMRPHPACGQEMLHPSLVRRLGQRVEVIEELDEGGVRRTPITYAPPNIPWPAAEITAGRAELPVYVAD